MLRLRLFSGANRRKSEGMRKTRKRLHGIQNLFSGDVAALKEAEPWLFSATPASQTGSTGLSNAGAASDKGRRLKRWEKLAGLGQDDE